MTYRYCQKCNFENGMASPTREEIIRNEHVCKNCGATYPVDEYTRIMYFIELEERVQRLEARLGL